MAPRPESWSFQVVAPEDAWALYVRFALDPNQRKASWWSVIARATEPLLVVKDEALDLPRRGSFEVRGDGLWADLHAHTGMRRWQVNFEGIALALEDFQADRGDRVPVEFEFEWESDAPWSDVPDGQAQRCAVIGDAEIRGSASLSLAEPVPGWRSHERGAP